MIESRRLKCTVAAGLLVLAIAVMCQVQSLWDLAKENRGLLKISTYRAGKRRKITQRARRFVQTRRVGAK